MIPYVRATWGLAAALAFATPAAAAPQSWSVVEPGISQSGCAGTRATLSLSEAGELALSASRDCQQALDPSPVGVVASTADLSTGLTFLGRKDAVRRHRYRTVAGKSRRRQGSATESRFLFAKGASRFALVLRVAGDGIAYRYDFPGATTIEREVSSFQLPAAARAFLSPYQVKYELEYSTAPAGGPASGEYGFPALFNVGRNWVLLSEADVNGAYPGARLTHRKGSGRYSLVLADPTSVSDRAFATPWRTAIIGSLTEIVSSTLNEDVATPSKIPDTSWIEPGVSAWSWLDGTRATQTSLIRQKQYVDYAASQGWKYLIVDDGWNSVNWMAELIAYARSKQVRIILWYRYTDVDTDAERAAEFGKIARWGAAGVKLDFMDSDSRATNQWYDDTLKSLVDHKLLVNFHGSTIPHGIQRTWPNVLTLEAVKGEENRRRSLEHILLLPFTRNVVGSMDYTPAAFQQSRPHSDAAELALAVLYESGLMVLGGSIDSYKAQPEAERFLRQVPAAWDEARLLAGEPGKSAVLARRAGSDWFIGGVLAGEARTLAVDTSFLGRGRWLIETVTDSDAGLAATRTFLGAGETLRVVIKANGGFAARACRVRVRGSNCGD